jgi:hypothetical protein
VATQTRNPTSDEAASGTLSGSAGSRWTLLDNHPDTTGSDVLTFGTTAASITFGFQAFTVPVGSTAISVQVLYYDGEAANGANNCGGRLKCGTTYHNAATHNPAGTTYTSRTDNFATNPRTAAAWTVDDVNGVGANALVAFGIGSTDSNPTFRVSSVQLQVTYTPLADRTGSGAGTTSAQTGSGSGALPAGGTGSGAVSAQTGSGSGTVVGDNPDRTGSGSGSATAQTGSGAGIAILDGGGAGTALAQTGSGSGDTIASGVGGGAQSSQVGAGSGASISSGLGTGTSSAQTSLGDGDAVVGGSGSGTASAQIGSGTGGSAAIEPRTGGGSGAPSAQTGTGTGSAVVSGAGVGSVSAQTGLGLGGGDTPAPAPVQHPPRRHAAAFNPVQRTRAFSTRWTRIRRTRG